MDEDFLGLKFKNLELRWYFDLSDFQRQAEDNMLPITSVCIIFKRWYRPK